MSKCNQCSLPHLEHLAGLDGSGCEYNTEVEVVLSIGSVCREPGVDDSSVGAACSAELQLVSPVQTRLLQLGRGTKRECSASDQILLVPLVSVHNSHLEMNKPINNVKVKNGLKKLRLKGGKVKT